MDRTQRCGANPFLRKKELGVEERNYNTQYAKSL